MIALWQMAQLLARCISPLASCIGWANWQIPGFKFYIYNYIYIYICTILIYIYKSIYIYILIYIYLSLSLIRLHIPRKQFPYHWLASPFDMLASTLLIQTVLQPFGNWVPTKVKLDSFSVMSGPLPTAMDSWKSVRF